jgi:signal transduction histidine kinase
VESHLRRLCDRYGLLSRTELAVLALREAWVPGTARVAVTASATAVRLRVQGDGEGPGVDEPAAARGGRRGISDMRAEARACGAALEIGRGKADRGTAVELRWPA